MLVALGLDFKCKTSLQILAGTKHEGEGLAGATFDNIELAIVKIVARVSATDLETKIGRFEKLIGPVDHQGGNLRKLVNHRWDQRVLKEIVGLGIRVAQFGADFIAP